MPADWTCPETLQVFPTGATPTPRQTLLGAMPFIPLAAPPAQVAYVPTYRSMYGNDRYGDCVTAEEAFTKSCYGYNIPDDIVTGWARSHGVLNGASLDYVLDSMATKGFQVSAQLYNDGKKLAVDYSNEALLQAAIAQGPVKLAIGAGALPGGAGSRDGTYALTSRNYSSDHSTTLCGYGPAEWLFEQLSIACPTACAGKRGYLHYTWAHIGFVTHDWLMGAADEAWLRDPTNIGVPPLTPPTPPTPPGPAPAPAAVILHLDGTLPPGDYVVVPKPF
jgi:hypothetical protein